MYLLADGCLNLFREVQQEQPLNCQFVVFLSGSLGREDEFSTRARRIIERSY